MAGDWKTSRIGDCFDLVNGYAFKSGEFIESGIPVIKIKNVKANRMLFDDLSYVSHEFLKTRADKVVQKGDLLITMSGNRFDGSPDTWVGKVAQFNEGRPFLLNQRVGILRPKKGAEVDRRFFSFSLSSHFYQTEFISIATSSGGQANLSPSQIFGAPIEYPPLAEQKAIAAVLGALDDKIELNRRMNATLEAMARALFQSWFVDFDPVRAKLDGRPPAALDPATAALFPANFEESSLGPIPRGWTADTIKSRASNVQYGFTQSATKEPVGPHFLRITDISGGRIDWASVPFCQATDEEREKYRIVDGDIFIARTGASTGDNIYAVEPPPAVFASYLIRIQFSSRGLGRLVGEFARTPDYASYVAGTIGGSAQPNASAQTLARASMVFPTMEIADTFYRTVRPLDLIRAANDRESRALATLRDTLLPKLLSGEVTPHLEAM